MLDDVLALLKSTIGIGMGLGLCGALMFFVLGLAWRKPLHIWPILLATTYALGISLVFLDPIRDGVLRHQYPGFAFMHFLFAVGNYKEFAYRLTAWATSIVAIAVVWYRLWGKRIEQREAWAILLGWGGATLLVVLIGIF